jgi:hypothetical protein
MPLKGILDEDWSEYDNKKKKEQDRKFFSCDEEWEQDYLIKLIRKKHPEQNRDEILRAIVLCCKSVPAPRPRKEFVACVMKRLGLTDGNPGNGNPPNNPNPGPANPPVPPANRKVG